MTTTDRNDPRLGQVDPATGLQATYLVLSDAERARGFVEPVRQIYAHVGTAGRSGCGTNTAMSLAIAETYARDPHFYGATYCAGCRTHLPVGPLGEFVWVEGGRPIHQRVGLTAEEQQRWDNPDPEVPGV